ncbi:site-specific integrase [Nemorincola caseinilytica]|uniref:Site-specific integrase n=1 Tax=Nemorincola caseinilytica TaxID=2054315 RepID=A0ABP8N9A3_9BACT
MISKSFAILFYLKKRTGVEQQTLPVYLRITVDGERKDIHTKQFWEQERWNKQAQRAKGTNESSRTLNAYLDALERDVQNARLRLTEAGLQVTVSEIEKILTGQEEKQRTLLQVFKEHNDKIAALVDMDYAEGTIERYKTTLDHTRRFIEWKYGKEDIELKSLTFEFVSDMEFWLKSARKCGHNSAIKYIANLRKIINICLKNGWLPKDPFYGFKMTKRDVVREYLSEEELQRLANKKFAVDRISQVRDIFLFSCYTGLAFIDVFNLTRERISKGVDGNQWIFTFRQKTDTSTRIPLLPQAQVILERYRSHSKCAANNKAFPVLSNQKMNSYLKEIADLCGIAKTLTYHIARHTFATTVTLNNDVPIESVSKMLGHKSIKITQHYAKIIDKKVSNDMQLLAEKMELKAIEGLQ